MTEAAFGVIQRDAITLSGLSKTYPGVAALRSVDLTLEPGQVHALLGANGSGKSTLVKILAGCEKPDAGGRILIGDVPMELGSPQSSAAAGCRFVHQNLALIDDMSVSDNILLSGGWPTRARTISSRRAHAEVRAALSAFGACLDPAAPVSELSSLSRTIVAIARAVRPEAEPIRALVLDEPTATLPRHDVAILERLVREIAAGGAIVVIVSHHLEEVLRIADIVTVLRDGELVLRAVPASTLSRTELITAMLGEEAVSGESAITNGPNPDSTAVLTCAGLVAPTFFDLSLTIQPGEIVGIAGLEGSGRTEVLRAIFGAIKPLAGSVAVAGSVIAPGRPKAAIAAGVAYLPGDRARLASVPEMTARENITLADLAPLSSPGWLKLKGERREAERWFELVDVRPAGALEQPLTSFSGGNQQKIMFARWLRRGPRVFLLDEPTQGVDVGAQAQLHERLRETAAGGAGVLISSSDEEELAAVCTRVLIMRKGRVVAELTGSELDPRSIAAAAVSGVGRVTGAVS